MTSAADVRIAPQRSSWFVSFFAIAVLLATGTQGAHAQMSSWTPDNEKVSLHLHGGVFSPLSTNAPSPTIGLRLSKLVGSHLQAGVLTGYTLQRKDLTQDVFSLPGVEPKLVLARVDASMIPLMGFLRVNFTEKHWLVPYVGVGTGFEWLTFQVTDYEFQETGTATYANLAWEGWVGLGIRLGETLRVNGELYYNGASLERDVYDDYGVLYKEVVDLDAVGARVGLDIIWQ